MHKYKVLGKKGEGTFAKVVTARDPKTNEVVAIKCMKGSFDNEEQVENLREMRALQRVLPHPNIICLQEVIFEKISQRLAFVFELMEMNLYEMIKMKRQFFTEEEVRYFIYEIMKGLEHMHHRGLFHRDVKPENILINRAPRQDTKSPANVIRSGSSGADAAGGGGKSADAALEVDESAGASPPSPAAAAAAPTSSSAYKGERYVIKIADLGSSKGIFTQQPYTEYISTRWYRPPECLVTDGYYSEKMDVWGAGCVFFELMTLYPLFPGSNELDQINRIHTVLGTPPRHVLEKLTSLSSHMNNDFVEKPGTGLDRLLPNVPAEAIDLLQWMLTYDAEERPTARQVLKHSYFKALRREDAQRERENRAQGKPPSTTKRSGGKRKSFVDGNGGAGAGAGNGRSQTEKKLFSSSTPSASAAAAAQNGKGGNNTINKSISNPNGGSGGEEEEDESQPAAVMAHRGRLPSIDAAANGSPTSSNSNNKWRGSTNNNSNEVVAPTQHSTGLPSIS